MRNIRVLGRLVVAAAILAAGCGVPTDDEPRPLVAEEIPGGLLAPGSTTTTEPGRPGVPTQLWFVRDQEDLQAVVVDLAGRTAESTVEALVGTVPEDLDEGLTSAIPPDTTVLGTSLRDGTLTINLSDEFSTASGDGQILAVAQIVLTATELNSVDRVEFEVDGEPRIVTDASGAEQNGPVTAADYASIRTFSSSDPGGG